MSRWIVLLRGINVSGQKKIIMSELREHVASLGYANIQSYIQSGNLVFDATDQSNQDQIQDQIKHLIKNTYGYNVEVFTIDPVWLENVAMANPYLQPADVDTKQLYLTILSKEPEEGDIHRLKDMTAITDEYIIIGRVMYIRYINGAGKSKLTNSLIESKLKVIATSRNWNTTRKLLELSK